MQNSSPVVSPNYVNPQKISSGLLKNQKISVLSQLRAGPLPKQQMNQHVLFFILCCELSIVYIVCFILYHMPILFVIELPSCYVLRIQLLGCYNDNKCMSYVAGQLEGSRSGSSLSLQRGLQPPSSSHRTAAGGAESSGAGSSVHRSTSSANPTSSAQKPSRRHSQDTHGTMHVSAAAAGASGGRCRVTASAPSHFVFTDVRLSLYDDQIRALNIGHRRGNKQLAILAD